MPSAIRLRRAIARPLGFLIYDECSLSERSAHRYLRERGARSIEAERTKAHRDVGVSAPDAECASFIAAGIGGQILLQAGPREQAGSLPLKGEAGSKEGLKGSNLLIRDNSFARGADVGFLSTGTLTVRLAKGNGRSIVAVDRILNHLEVRQLYHFAPSVFGPLHLTPMQPILRLI